MSILSLKHLLLLGTLCAGSAVLTTGCVSDDYDLDNLDMTMGLGSDGLKLKLGTTQQIMLNDILDLDESVKLDGSNLYYLVEEGSTNFDVKVDPVDATFEKSRIETSQRVLDYETAKQQLDPSIIALIPSNGGLPIEGGLTLNGKAEGYSDVKISVKVPVEVKRIDLVDVKDMKISLSIHTATSPNVKFGIDKIKDFKITIPQILVVDPTSLSEGWVLEGNVLKHVGELKVKGDQELCHVTATQVDPLSFGTPQDGEIKFGKDAQGRSVVEAGIEGDVYFKATQDFTLTTSDYADIYLELQLGNGNRIDIEKVQGLFNPEIDPTVDPIDIASSLPDFLNDPAVRIGAANPTLKFDADLTQIPVGLNLSADLQAVKKGEGAFKKNVVLPQTQVSPNKRNVVYYSETGTPYDPEVASIPADAQKAKAENLSDLIERLPDEIRVDLGNGHLNVQQKPYSITLGKTYKASAEYRVFVPFQFDRGLTIVYNDSTDSMGDDLKDYTAEGIQIDAVAESTIPLDLVATVTAYDVNGKVIPGIQFDQVKVAASNGTAVKESPLTVKATLTDPALLQKMDRVKFSVKAANNVNDKVHELRSTQYLRIKDIRLRLAGKVTADFN